MELFFHFLFQIVQLNAVLAVGCSVSYSILCLGHFYFTIVLLPTLLATAKISPDSNVRIVKISFMGHMFCGGIDFNTFKEGPVRKKKGLQFCMAKANRFVFFPRPYINICHIREISMYKWICPSICQWKPRHRFYPGNFQTDTKRTWTHFSISW